MVGGGGPISGLKPIDKAQTGGHRRVSLGSTGEVTGDLGGREEELSDLLWGHMGGQCPSSALVGRKAWKAKVAPKTDRVLILPVNRHPARPVLYFFDFFGRLLEFR